MLALLLLMHNITGFSESAQHMLQARAQQTEIWINLIFGTNFQTWNIHPPWVSTALRERSEVHLDDHTNEIQM